MARRSSATDLGDALVAALAERDFDRLAGTLAPDVRMRALIPPGPIDLLGANPAAARFATWFGESDGFELVHSGSDEVGDRLHVFYRLRVKRPGDSWKVIEQHLFCALDEGRITALDLVCSGFRLDRGNRRRRDDQAAQRKSLPKAGAFAHAEAKVVAQRITEGVEGKMPDAAFDGHGYCWIELGDGRAGFAGGDFYAEPEPKIKLRRRPGRPLHWGKVAFEQWWIHHWL